MTDKPILFSLPMILALRADLKTQTRRVLNPQPECDFIRADFTDNQLIIQPAVVFGRPTHKMLARLHRPTYRLWVREAWKPHSLYDHMKPRDMPVSTIFYLADDAYAPSGSRGRPGMFMPRWASRMTLVVTETRVQRLQDISRSDCMEEGCPFPNMAKGPNPRDWYADLWDGINGAGAWAANPYVVAYTFTVHHCNIDQMDGGHGR